MGAHIRFFAAPRFSQTKSDRCESVRSITNSPLITIMCTVVEKIVNACYPVKCDKCGKTTWKGCGNHIDSVMSEIKEEDRCSCPR
ncbi:hypothetical protein F5148DRAFT_131462 [Russula earlei]|uniref:Uncharacterized protein n=1 Tax=Russula earlei TaxID=71964 RepID=A0ACC0U721_9AGAM|nr:hypothetical protein F5148DRAFT_131462 [Russula earlei]